MATQEFPKHITVREEQLVHDAHITGPNPAFLDDLKRLGWYVTQQHAFDWDGMPDSARGYTPLLFADAYTRRSVELPTFTVDPLLRADLIEKGARLVTVLPTAVDEHYGGGQKVRQQLGIRVYPQFGPLIAVTSKNDAPSILNNILAVYQGDQYSEELFKLAVDEAMGGGMLIEKARVPVGIVSFPQNDGRPPSVAEYFPDSQTVIGPGGLLPFPVSDEKTRAALVWQGY